MTTPPEDEHDEDFTPAVPEPPRRVPFGVAVTTGFLALLAILLTVGAIAALTATGLYEETVGEAAVEGLAVVLIVVCAVLVAATAWSFARNGNTIASMVAGGLTLLFGLIILVNAILTNADTEGVRVGVVALGVGLGITLPPLIGQSPLYLAARRVWAKAEKEWLRDLATSDTPPAPAPHQPWGQPWTPYPTTHHQPWPQPAPPQPWPGPHATPGPYAAPGPNPYSAPAPHQPAPPQPHQGQTWTSPHPFDYQGLPTNPAPGPVWPAAAAPPGDGRPTAEAPQVPHSGPPQAAAQHAPTEHIRTAASAPEPTSAAPQSTPPSP